MKKSLLLALLFIVTFSQCRNTPDEAEIRRRVVDDNGQLSVFGTNIVNEQGDTTVLQGMSMFWSQWNDKHYNYKCIKWLRDDWHVDVIRLALAVEYDGYLENPKKEKKKITRLIEVCLDLGIYVIVDWHSHLAEESTQEAVDFFSQIARDYGEYPNVLYEIYNEPLNVSWDTVVKPYLDTVIAAIRLYDPDNIIIVGSPNWSQNVDEASDNPIDDENVAYSLHFYAATHKESLREKASYAIENGLALWVTEFGTVEANGDGDMDYKELGIWFYFMEEHKLSWCNWSVADKDESASILKPGTRVKGNWKEEDLTESGKYIRDKLRAVNP